jgi:hypothetical protein
MASLMSKKATPLTNIFSSKVASSSAAPARRVDVNSGTAKNKGLLQEFEKAQELLRQRQRAGGKLGFAV